MSKVFHIRVNDRVVEKVLSLVSSANSEHNGVPITPADIFSDAILKYKPDLETLRLAKKDIKETIIHFYTIEKKNDLKELDSIVAKIKKAQECLDPVIRKPRGKKETNNVDINS